MVGQPCPQGMLASVDGYTITDRELTVLKTIEGLTGLNHTNVTGFLTMLERRSLLALARRSSIEMGEADFRVALDDHLRTTQKPGKIAAVFREVGERDYREWFIAPQLAEKRLTDYYQRELDERARKRAETLLTAVVAHGREAADIAKIAGGQVKYARFRLTPFELLQHYGEGLRLDYNDRLEAYKRGLEPAPPPMPRAPVEHVFGLGYGEPGYVKRLSSIFKGLENGAWSREVIRDRRQWMVLRRLSGNGAVYEGEGLTVPLPEFHDWLVSRYRELEIKICSSHLLEEARRVAPTNAFVEMLR
jgi:hypothetical protein